MQHYVIDSDFVGPRCTTINRQPFYTSTVFLSRFGVFIASFANYYRTGKVAFF